MRICRILLLSFTFGLLPLPARSEIILGPVFKDHAVLQRGKPMPVWGRAQAGEKLVITFGDQTL
ncbi:MAG: sialate O-acetylesterase, partial [Opitutus sp.]